MSFNPNWVRWIQASCAQYFKTQADKQTIPIFFEGTDKQDRENTPNYVEFRLNGPFAREESKDYWALIFDINIIICVKTDPKDLYIIQRVSGYVASWFLPSLLIYQLGNGPDDDQSLLGCAILDIQGVQGGIFVEYYGKFDPTLPVQEATVEASYKMILEL